MSKLKIVYGKGARPDLDLEREVLGEHRLKNEYELVLKDPYRDTEGFLEEIRDADGVCAFIPFGPDVLDRMRKCRIVALPSLGTDFADCSAATERGIYITNLPTSYCIEEVAAHTCSLILDCSRRITAMAASLKGDMESWDERRKYRGNPHRLKGQKMGFCSFGNIARRTAEMMKGFGVEILAYDPFLPDNVFETAGAVKVDSLEELFRQCSIISVQTPHTEKTHHMIGEKQFAAAAPGLVIAACGRGGVIDEAALRKAVEKGIVFAAGLDVLEDEDAFDSVLFGLPEVVITPHTAYYSVEAEQDFHRINLEDILTVLENDSVPDNLVNREVIGKERPAG